MSKFDQLYDKKSAEIAKRIGAIGNDVENQYADVANQFSYSSSFSSPSDQNFILRSIDRITEYCSSFFRNEGNKNTKLAKSVKEINQKLQKTLAKVAKEEKNVEDKSEEITHRYFEKYYDVTNKKSMLPSILFSTPSKESVSSSTLPEESEGQCRPSGVVFHADVLDNC